ncbi:MAG: hypothetical protein A2V88_12155 [Elusimicrobia bacterium RBG_16_66_12]|nr:MAG: hypothetical protein A2V88_12155 [Elusimicrobia bacterium RBG_16_66_12]
MESVKVYRSVNAGDRFFGLELADGVLLLLVFFLAFSFNREGLFANGVVLLLTYFGIRALKRNKPEGYVLDLTRYVLASRFKAVCAFDDAESMKGDKA